MNHFTRFFLVLFVMVNAVSSFAQHNIRFADSTLAMALERSGQQHKPVFFMCYASWCPHCNKMKKDVFTDPAVADFYNEHFVCIAMDMEKGGGVDLHTSYHIKSYPTFIFMNSDGTTFYRTTGEFAADEFLMEGYNALDPKKQLAYRKKQFENDISNPEKCYEYLRALKKAELDYSDVVQKYFATQSDKQLLTEINWRIISNGIHELDAREFRFVLDHQAAYAQIASPERVEKKIVFTVKEILAPLIDANDTINYFSKRQLALNIHHPAVDSLVFSYDLMVYEKNNNWNAYKKTTLQSVPQLAWNNYTLLNSIATNYLKKITDQPALKQAITWAQRSLLLHEEYGTYILCAGLFRKINNNASAAQMAQQGKDLALKYGWDHPEADQLLKELKPVKKKN